MSLDNLDKQLLARIERKPYKRYKLSDLHLVHNHTLSLSEEEEESTEIESRLNQLVFHGLVREETFYSSPKAKI